MEKREIYIVEGDLPLGSAKLSRDAEYQGIMPVRGKILNCQGGLRPFFKKAIITDLIRAGCGVEIQNKHVKDRQPLTWNNPVEQGGHLHRWRRGTASRSGR